MGSFILFGSGQKIREWATAPQKLFGEIRLAVKPESARGFSVILVIGGLPLPAGKAQTTPCFPGSRASPLPSKLGSLKSGLRSAKTSWTKTVWVRSEPLSVIATAKGLTPAPSCTVAASVREDVSTIDTVPSV